MRGLLRGRSFTTPGTGTQLDRKTKPGFNGQNRARPIVTNQDARNRLSHGEEIGPMMKHASVYDFFSAKMSFYCLVYD